MNTFKFNHSLIGGLITIIGETKSGKTILLEEIKENIDSSVNWVYYSEQFMVDHTFDNLMDDISDEIEDGVAFFLLDLPALLMRLHCTAIMDPRRRLKLMKEVLMNTCHKHRINIVITENLPKGVGIEDIDPDSYKLSDVVYTTASIKEEYTKVITVSKIKDRYTEGIGLYNSEISYIKLGE